MEVFLLLLQLQQKSIRNISKLRGWNFKNEIQMCLINLAERCKENLQAVWAKHAWNLGCDLTWPLASLNLLLWGTRVWGQPGCFHPTYTAILFARLRGCPVSASCSSVMTQPNSRGRKLSWMDHWFDLK